MSFKYLQGRGLLHFPGLPVPVLGNPFGEEIFPDTQSKSPLTQREATASHAITGYVGEDPDPTSLQCPPFR